MSSIKFNIEIIEESDVCSKLSQGFYIVDMSKIKEGLPYDIIYIDGEKPNFIGSLFTLDLEKIKEILSQTNQK